MTFIDLLSTYHIMPQFPPGAVRQAEGFKKDVTTEDLAGRKDLTDKLIITIDGDDAKDFDDAISIDLLENGNYCLGVHIADVTHYVKKDSAIDRAAFSRGTSVYLIDTVVPMLPFELSNELCSLKPNKVRLAVSVFMEITPRGKVEGYEICESFIKSSNRMTYANVTKILDGDEKLCTQYAHLVSMLHQMKRLAAILKKKRISEGSIEFETHESKITLDHSGQPLSVERYPITLSNGIIEEFMLICNVTVAKHLVAKGLPCVFRVHETPDAMRLERLGEILPILGIDYPLGVNPRPRDFQKILELVKTEEISEVVNYLLLRSMAKAKYSEKNQGHFGLGFDTYCHFTSPIRRYADVAVHRILKESLKGDLSERLIKHYKEVAVSAAVTASVTEINAAEAELQWKSVKKAEYMANKIGERYSGTITHIMPSGFFVELPDTVEGFVAASTLEDDIYVLEENGVSMVGLSTKRAFTVGDRIEIKVAAVDTERVFVDFEVVGMSRLIPMKRKSSRKTSRKSEEERRNKKILREITDEQKAKKAERLELKKKADAEKTVFENAVIATLFELISQKHKFNRAEKGFVGVTLQDFAAMISNPFYKAALSDFADFSLKNMLISASVNTKNTVRLLGESFGFEVNEKLANTASEFVCAALRHMDACLRLEGFNYSKRENEYASIAKKYEEKKVGAK